MGVLYFTVELLDDVVLSQRTATVGEHKSLDYIPGSAFLGVAASRIYQKVDKSVAWDFFHSSKLCFYNAYPKVDEKRSIPMPLSFHGEKVPQIGKENDILNFVYPEVKEAGIQYRQNRTGFVNFSNNRKLSVITTAKTSRMRTAIEAKTGTAAKSQLYGYESLDAGQVFVSKIEWDESLDKHITQIVDLFKEGEVIHIGRSKTASYGRVRICNSRIDSVQKPINEEKLEGKSFSILAISDLCLRNSDTGTPELQLLPQFLGLGAHWILDRTRSFSRSSYLYQYNAYRREIEVQKTLISKGSVFTFKSGQDITTDEKEKIRSCIVRGIGDARGQGFGEITLFNIEKEFTKENIQEKTPVFEKKLTTDEEAWLTWLAPVFLSPNIEDKVKKAVAEFIHLCHAIKTFQTFDDETEFWPKNSQWVQILEEVRECTSKEDLKVKLFNGESPVIKEVKESQTEKNKDTKVSNPDPEWNYESSPKGKTLRKWLMDFIDDKDFTDDKKLDDKELKIALQELVKRCNDAINSSNWLKGE